MKSVMKLPLKQRYKNNIEIFNDLIAYIYRNEMCNQVTNEIYNEVTNALKIKK